MADSQAYAVFVKPLPEDEGGGYLATVPDLPGCMSDGKTMAEAIENVQGAIVSWFEAASELGRSVPDPGTTLGQWRQRVPASLHVTLKRVAQNEGVSLNAFVSAVLAEAVGRKIGESA